MQYRHLRMMALLVAGFMAAPAYAKTSEYSLTVDQLPVNITGTPIKKITVNGGIPAPTLRFTEGDEAVINDELTGSVGLRLMF